MQLCCELLNLTDYNLAFRGFFRVPSTKGTPLVEEGIMLTTNIAFLIGTLLLNAPGLVNDEVHCLTENIYYEARAEPLDGLYAVAEVTYNRVHSPVFKKDTACGVIYQPYQFAWTRSKYPIREPAMWERSQKVALSYYYFGKWVKPVVPEALFFHSGKPLGYHSKLTYLKQIGGHKFYSL